MNDAMAAEFDTVAEWTARVAAELGHDYHLPAACRGSGSPAALDWLIGRMDLRSGLHLLDCGAGVGGPAAYAVQLRGVLPVLVDPEEGACRAARRLFDFPVIRAAGSALPVADSSFDAAWALGVLCTTADQLGLLNELRRTVRAGGRVGLLVFVARRVLSSEEAGSNHFPTVDSLRRSITDAQLDVEDWTCTADLPPIPSVWSERETAVTEALAAQYGHTSVWRTAEKESSRIGRLLEDGALSGELLVLRRN